MFRRPLGNFLSHFAAAKKRLAPSRQYIRPAGLCFQRAQDVLGSADQLLAQQAAGYRIEPIEQLTPERKAPLCGLTGAREKNVIMANPTCVFLLVIQILINQKNKFTVQSHCHTALHLFVTAAEQRLTPLDWIVTRSLESVAILEQQQSSIVERLNL